MTYWVESLDGDNLDFQMYRRHYSASKNPRPKIRQFVGPGQKTVLTGFMCPALFVWRKFIDDSGQKGVNCAVFRNESSHRSSSMILEAEEYARKRWGKERLYTLINPKKTKSKNPGYCFIMAGWKREGVTKKGLIVLSKGGSS